MSWRVARSLETLLGQLNNRFPNRSKASDGSIGDTAHSARKSDHNPDSGGVVRARDYTHDPKAGVDIARLARELQASRDDRISYVICNGQIMSGPGGPSPWVFRRYTGANAHTKHLHLSVVAGGRGDEPRAWALPMLGGSAPAPAPAADVLRRGSKGDQVRALQRKLGVAVDGDFGPKTEAAVKAAQKRYGLTVDGIVGPKTRAALGL